MEPAVGEYRERRYDDRPVARGRADEVRCGSEIPENGADRLGVFPAGGSERDPVASPDEELGPEIVLEQPHVPADGA